MPDKYFVLQADRPLEPEQPWYHIPGLKTEMMTDLGMLPPTAASIAARHLEWLIPNTQYNQGWVSMKYSHFKVLKQGQERTEVDEVPLLEGLPEPLTVEDIKEAPEGPGDIPEKTPPQTDETTEADKKKEPGPDYFAKPSNPNEVKALKATIVEKLSESGITSPKNSTLKTLQELLRAKIGG